MDIINIGILAHVDAGKTTLTEQILYVSGTTRSVGSVDEGSTHTDSLEVERRRGISVKAASVQIVWKGKEINIIDTPGHTDFSSEIERSLIPLECAVMVVSAVEGVQPQTRAIYKALKKFQIPALFFINKTDRMGADVKRTVEDIKEQLEISPADYCDRESVVEALCEHNDDMLAEYLEKGIEGIPEDKLKAELRKQFGDMRTSIFLSGSAVNREGVEEVLDAVVEICPCFADYIAKINEKEDMPSDSMRGIVFKIEHSKSLGRTAHIKLLTGFMKNRDVVFNKTRGKTEKVVQIRKNQGTKVVDSGILKAGEIGIASGFALTRAGDIFTESENCYVPVVLRAMQASGSIAVPLLRAKVTPNDEKDYPALVAAIEELSAEDPNLNMIWVKEEREMIVNISGAVQLEILEETMKERFGLNAEFGKPSVIYKETATVKAEGFDAYTMPKPCWAILRFLIEPGENGSGIIYKSVVNANKIFPAYQAQVEQALPDALKQGTLGWEVTDVKITLIDGEHHIMHTHPLDFIVATPLAIMNGLVNAKTTLLEPMYNFKLSVPEDLRGKVLGEIINMRGETSTPAVNKGVFHLEGTYPVATGMDFPIRLASMTKGQGILRLDFGGYKKCDISLGQTSPYRGINPLDRAKYILHARHAL